MLKQAYKNSKSFYWFSTGIKTKKNTKLKPSYVKEQYSGETQHNSWDGKAKG